MRGLYAGSEEDGEDGGEGDGGEGDGGRGCFVWVLFFLGGRGKGSWRALFVLGKVLVCAQDRYGGLV